MEPVLTDEFVVRSFDPKRNALFFGAHIGNNPVVFRQPSDTHYWRGRPPNQARCPFAVTWHKQLAFGRHQFRESALFLRNSRDIAEKFEMLPADAGDDPVPRLNHPHQWGQLTWVIRSDF